MKQAHIYLHGVIGSYQDSNGNLVRGIELVDVIAQVRANAADEYLVHCKGPGGLVETGDQIYDYLESLKSQATINTITDGDVGSILTKIYLVGEKRTIVEGHKFFIHNPWTQPNPGDSKHITQEVEALKHAEAKLRNFYVIKTAITENGLASLMDNETEMTAEQAVALGFATDKIAAPVKAFALLKSHTNTHMATLGQKIGQLIDQAFGNKPKALMLQLADGTNISVSSESADQLEGADAVTVDEAGNPTGTPAPDGEHTLSDGRVIVVSQGKVTEVKPSEPEPQDTGDLNAKIEALEKTVATALTELNKKFENVSKPVNVDEKISAAITQLKSDLNVGNKPPKAINNTGQVTKPLKVSPIQAKMKELNGKK